MIDDQTPRRTLLQLLAALPAVALATRPSLAATQASRVVVFNGVKEAAAPGIDVHVFGWAAETPQGWIGRTVDAGVGEAIADFPGTAAGVTKTVPKGTPNTINGHTDKDGVRGSSVCFEDVTAGSVEGSMVKLQGRLTHAENPEIFIIGDPMSLEGNPDTGEFTFTLRGGGKDNVFDMKGVIIIS